MPALFWREVLSCLNIACFYFAAEIVINIERGFSLKDIVENILDRHPLHIFLVGERQRQFISSSFSVASVKRGNFSDIIGSAF